MFNIGIPVKLFNAIILIIPLRFIIILYTVYNILMKIFKTNFILIIALVLTDLLSFYLSLFLAYQIRYILFYLLPGRLVPMSFSFLSFLKMWWMPFITIVLIWTMSLYKKRLPFWIEASTLIKILTLNSVLIFAMVSLGKLLDEVSRGVLILFWLTSLFLFPLLRLIVKLTLFNFNLFKERILFLGAGKTAKDSASGLLYDKYLGYHLIGFLDDDKEKWGNLLEICGKNYKVFGSINHFKKFIKKLNISTIVIAMPSLDAQSSSKLVGKVQLLVNKVIVVPDFKGVALLNSELLTLFDQRLFLISIKNNLKSKTSQVVKRIFDLVLCLAFFWLILPIIIIIAMLIKRDSEGSVFFIQERVGKHGKPFKCIKFRSMISNSDEVLNNYLNENPEKKLEWQKFKKIKGFDPRVTKFGRFLRKTSLDELPQIFNVVKGDMSLVGPRPYLFSEIPEMQDYKETILLTVPGITGLWQISGRSELNFNERLNIDVWYILNWSVWLDLEILFKTLSVVIKREGAY